MGNARQHRKAVYASKRVSATGYQCDHTKHSQQQPQNKLAHHISPSRMNRPRPESLVELIAKRKSLAYRMLVAISAQDHHTSSMEPLPEDMEVWVHSPYLQRSR